MGMVTRYPNADGAVNQWTCLSGSDRYAMVDETSPDDDTTYIYEKTTSQKNSFTFPTTPAVPTGATNISVKVYRRCKKSGLLNEFNSQPFLRIDATYSYGTANEETTTYTTRMEIISRPGGGSWTVAEINGTGWQAGIEADHASGVGDDFCRCTQLYVEINYDLAGDEAATSLETDRSTNPTYVGDTPVFTALYQAAGDSGTADRYKIEVSEDSEFGSFKWQSGEQTLSPTCTDNQRCTEIAYGGGSLQSDVTYYWRIQLYQSGRTGTWSTSTATFSGINRDWQDPEYPVRRKLTVNADHDGIASGELLSFDFETGKRIILASDGCFDEAVQASGGFSIARHAGRTHVAYLSRLESTDAKLGIRVVTINHITGEVGASHYIDTSGTTYDTHHFPVIEVTPDGYLHVFYGGHYGTIKYRRSKYINESGSLSTDHTDTAMWVNANTGADAYMTPSSATGPYPIAFHIPTGDDAGRLYMCWRNYTAPAERHYSFIYSDDSGSTWSAIHDFIKDTSASAKRVYCYGVRFDRKAQRLHISWSHNFTGDTEQGIWYAYCDYDETDGSSLDVGLNIWRWADGTLAGRTKTTGAQVPIDYTLAKAITTSAAELSLVFTETLVIDKNGDPVVFWEQKFNQGTNLWAHQTNLMCARWSGSAWVIYCISDQVNTKLRVRRSSVAIGLDKDGVIHAIMPVASKTQWRQLATGDDDDVGVTLASGTDNYAMIDDGFTRVDQTSWLKMSAVGSKASFTHGTSNADDINKIFSVEVVAFAKSTGSASSVKLYLDDGTSSDLATAQTISTSAITRYTKEWTTNPFTAAAWATGDIAGLRFGVQCDSTNEVQVFSVFMRFTFMRSTDENLGAAELHELTSSDNGVTWQIQERSRNSMVGVPMMNHPHHLAGDVFEAIWTSGHDVFYYSNERFGLMLPTGVDVRIRHGATEIDRVATYWNLNKSRIFFKAQEAIAAGKTVGASDYYLEYGNRNASDQPQGGPADIWQGFWNFEEMAEGDGLGTHADWTVNDGAASIYSALTNHRNKVYAGNHAVKTTSHPFGASTVIGTDVTDVFIEAGIWLEGSSSYSYLAAYDLTGAIDFRVGVNASTNRPCYYDGTWHDVTTAGYADRANMNNVALLVTSKGCSAWVNGVLICEEVTRITVVDYILIGAASESYFDLIRWSKRPYTTKDYTTTTGFDDATALYSTDHTATKEANDAYHNIPTTPWQKSRIKRVDVTVDVRNDIAEVTGFTISTHCWIGGSSPYDSADTVGDATHDHTGIDGGSTWQGSYVYSFTDLDIGPKAVKVDCYATTVTESPSTSEARITQIKIWTKDRDPIIVIGDAEWRGFRMDATLQGSGQIQFFMDANLDAAFMRTSACSILENNAAVECTDQVCIENLHSITSQSKMSFEFSEHLKAYCQCVLESLHGTVAETIAPAEWGGQAVFPQQVVIGNLAGMTSEGAMRFDFAGGLKTQMLTSLEVGAAVSADGRLVMDFSGSVTARSVVIIESSHRIDTQVAVPFEILAALLTEHQGAIEFGQGAQARQQVVLAYVGTLTTQGMFVYDHLAMLKLRTIANMESGAGATSQAIYPFGHTQALTPTQVALPFAYLSSPRATAAALAEWGAQSTSKHQVTIDTGQAIASQGQIVIENLGSLLTQAQLPIEWMGAVVTTAFGRFPIEWTGGMTLQTRALLESGAGMTPSNCRAVLEFKGGIKASQRVVWSNLAAHQSTGQVSIETGAGFSGESQVVAESGEGVSSTTQASLESGAGLSASQQTILSNLSGHKSQAQAILGNLTSVSLKLISIIEWAEGKAMKGQLPCDWQTAVQLAGQFPIEWTGGTSVAAFGRFPIEWTVKVAADGAVGLEFGSQSILNAVMSFEHGAGVGSSLKAPIEINNLAAIIQQVSYETLLKMNSIGQVSFDVGQITQAKLQAGLEHLFGMASEAKLPIEWLGAKAITIGAKFPISWTASVVARQAANVEWLSGLTPVQNRVLIDWGLGSSAIVSQVGIEWGGGVQSTANCLAEWLQTIGAYGRVSFDHLESVGLVMQVDIEWGEGLLTRSSIPFEHLQGLVASGKLPMDWVGFAVTMFTVLSAEARIPGVLGATAGLPGVREAIATIIEIKKAEARTADAKEATASIIEILNSQIIGGA